MRICGVTFDHTTNYGSCLQAYALQTVIEKMTVRNEPCSYALLPASTIILNDFKKKTVSKRPLRIRVKNRMLQQITRTRRKQFEIFEKEKMHYADCTDRQQLPKLNQQFDAFVCGSDVIWNFSFTQADPIYFLDFAEKYRFSYAASFGKADIHYESEEVSLQEGYEEIYRRYLPGFDQISVREKSAVEIAEAFTGKKVNRVCDPVLLLDRVEWDRMIPQRSAGKRFIFAYNTSIKPNFDIFLKTLHRQTGLPVVHVVWKASDAVRQKTLCFPEPREWLQALRDAEYVVTNSFHATAFSILYKKNFFTVMQDGKLDRTNVRIYDFLSSAGLDNRIITDTPDLIDCTAPDFTEADEEIRRRREESLLFIRENLEAAMKEKQDGKSTHKPHGSEQ